MIRKNKGILIVFSGFSGSGKGTIMKELMRRYSDIYALSISATTRAPRNGETDGVEYFFRTTEQFEDMIRNDELVEYAKYVENYYGTPRTYVEEQLFCTDLTLPSVQVGDRTYDVTEVTDALLEERQY